MDSVLTTVFVMLRIVLNTYPPTRGIRRRRSREARGRRGLDHRPPP